MEEFLEAKTYIFMLLFFFPLCYSTNHALKLLVNSETDRFICSRKWPWKSVGLTDKGGRDWLSVGRLLFGEMWELMVNRQTRFSAWRAVWKSVWVANIQSEAWPRVSIISWVDESHELRMLGMEDKAWKLWGHQTQSAPFHVEMKAIILVLLSSWCPGTEPSSLAQS